ncbi:MAG: beta-propeller fold lactonase family protein [Coriobacteriia bacterium]|nr:beta-propeller fold lactonase family protein [Coriobacteriia bacterium]
MGGYKYRRRRSTHLYELGAPRRRRRSAKGLGLVLIALLIVVLTIGGGIFLLTRPASASIIASPSDAIITFNNTSATGTLEMAELEPGVYTVSVERKDFEPFATSVELKRGRKAKLEYALTPLPVLVSVTTHPEGAVCTITLEDGQVISGVAPFEQQISAGPVQLSLSMAGYNTFTSDFFLEETRTVDYYMDPEGQILHGLGTITTLGAPKGVSVTHDGGEAWTSILNGPPSIEIFDPRTGAKIGEVDIGEYGAVEVIFNKAGTLAYTSQMETAKCFEIDVKTRTVVREFDTKSAWTKWVELSPDEKTLYASNWSGDDVSIIDLESGELVKRVGVSDTPRGMYATDDGRFLYVAGFDSGDLERIDLATYKKTVLFTDGGALRHIVADEATHRLFISDMSKDLIWVHDMVTGKTTKFIDVDEKPNTIDLTPDAKMLFVSCRGENNPKTYYIPGPEWGSILVFDTGNGTPLDALIAGNQPTALDVSDDGKLLIFSDFLDNRLRVFEIPDYATFTAGGGGRFEAHFAEIKK